MLSPEKLKQADIEIRALFEQEASVDWQMVVHIPPADWTREEAEEWYQIRDSLWRAMQSPSEATVRDLQVHATKFGGREFWERLYLAAIEYEFGPAFVQVLKMVFGG